MTDQVVVTNRKAHHEFHLFDKYEAGIVLQGSEVKSIREGKANLSDAYIRISNGEVFVVNLHISLYRFTTVFAPEPTRMRKLLLKRQEIERLIGQLSKKRCACVPLRLYFKRGYVKIEIAIAKKKLAHDKRAAIKEKIQKREIDRAMKSRFKR